MTRDVAIVACAQHAVAREERNEPEMLLPVLQRVMSDAGLDRADFTVSGSSDYLVGQPFSFVAALDAVGAWPPIAESHVEQDGAWALYEAWLRLQEEDAETALVYSFGRSSPGDVERILALQLDPYTVAPLWPDQRGLAGLQTRLLLDAGLISDEQLAEVVARSLADAVGNPHAVRSDAGATVETVTASGRSADPLLDLDGPPVTDGCAAVVLAVGDRARELTDTPVWIRGIDHRIEPSHLGVRDLTASPSTTTAARAVGIDGGVDLAELHAAYAAHELVLRRALSLGDDARINPSGGALASHPVMVAGLVRFVEAATRLATGDAHRGVAHATAGPCLQHNLVALLESGQVPDTSGVGDEPGKRLDHDTVEQQRTGRVV